jgi:hypothetical protein
MRGAMRYEGWQGSIVDEIVSDEQFEVWCLELAALAKEEPDLFSEELWQMRW